MKIEASWLHLVGVAAMSIAGILVGTAAAQNEDAAARARAIRSMIVKWAGNHDTDAFLRQPAVRSELQKLLGSELDHLMHNLNVRGAVDLNGQTLSVNGNAPHQGTEEEAIVCVTILPLKTIVEAAILSKEAVTVYARAEKYEYASICIKDWITLANSRHADRFVQPANVRVMKPQY
jgi:enoyl reductase-like protein